MNQNNVSFHIIIYTICFNNEVLALNEPEQRKKSSMHFNNIKCHPQPSHHSQNQKALCNIKMPLEMGESFLHLICSDKLPLKREKPFFRPFLWRVVWTYSQVDLIPKFYFEGDTFITYRILPWSTLKKIQFFFPLQSSFHTKEKIFSAKMFIQDI